MGRIHLVLGPVGAGKSTYARSLRREHHAVLLTLDDWMATLFRPDRPAEGVLAWYLERTARCADQIWNVTRSLLDVDTSVVLEIGLVRRQDRDLFFGRVDAEALDLTIHLLDAPRDVRRERVLRRNTERGETYSMEVPLPMFELASDAWEPLADDESRGRDVHRVATG